MNCCVFVVLRLGETYKSGNKLSQAQNKGHLIQPTKPVVQMQSCLYSKEIKEGVGKFKKKYDSVGRYKLRRDECEFLEKL